MQKSVSGNHAKVGINHVKVSMKPEKSDYATM